MLAKAQTARGDGLNALFFGEYGGPAMPCLAGGASLQAYVRADPINLADPTALRAARTLLVIAAIGKTAVPEAEKVKLSTDHSNAHE